MTLPAKADHRRNPLFNRSPGEIAFDRCMRSFIFLGIMVAALGPLDGIMQRRFGHFVLTLWSHSFDGHIPTAIFIAILLAVNWSMALRNVVESWSDPVTRVQRIGSVILLSAHFLFIGVFVSTALQATGASGYWPWTAF